MTKQYTNTSNIPLSVAVFLADDHYDFTHRPEKAISATDLNKSVRQYILSKRVNASGTPNLLDISGFVKSKMGSAIHEGIEHTWLDETKRKTALQKLGIRPRVIDLIKVNPTEVGEDDIPIYIEQRDSIEILGWTISGMFDCVFDGTLQDFKSTGTFSYGTENDWKYILQGSIYRLIHESKITSDHLEIIWWFTDWNADRAKKTKGYPNNPIMVHKLPLMSKERTRAVIIDFISEIEKHWNTPEAELPLCSDKHLWRKEPTYKVFKDANASRAMPGGGTFPNLYAAQAFATLKGGVVRKIDSPAKACNYCPANNSCTQYKHLHSIRNIK